VSGEDVGPHKRRETQHHYTNGACTKCPHVAMLAARRTGSIVSSSLAVLSILPTASIDFYRQSAPNVRERYIGALQFDGPYDKKSGVGNRQPRSSNSFLDE
jgi:hypothetical protein